MTNIEHHNIFKLHHSVTGILLREVKLQAVCVLRFQNTVTNTVRIKIMFYTFTFYMKITVVSTISHPLGITLVIDKDHLVYPNIMQKYLGTNLGHFRYWCSHYQKGKAHYNTDLETSLPTFEG